MQNAKGERLIMAVRKLVIERVRFSLYQPDTLVFSGWFQPFYKDSCSLAVFCREKELPVELKYRKGVEVRQKYIAEDFEINEEVIGTVKLPCGWEQNGDFRCFCIYSARRNCSIFPW